jgi:hypothetical protein
VQRASHSRLAAVHVAQDTSWLREDAAETHGPWPAFTIRRRGSRFTHQRVPRFTSKRPQPDGRPAPDRNTCAARTEGRGRGLIDKVEHGGKMVGIPQAGC